MVQPDSWVLALCKVAGPRFFCLALSFSTFAGSWSRFCRFRFLSAGSLWHIYVMLCYVMYRAPVASRPHLLRLGAEAKQWVV